MLNVFTYSDWNISILEWLLTAEDVYCTTSHVIAKLNVLLA